MFVLAAGSAGAPVIGGYDVVEYQSLPATANGTLGSQRFAYNLTTVDMNNATTGQRMQPTAYEFWFSSAANLERFKADPWRYTPAWGGF